MLAKVNNRVIKVKMIDANYNDHAVEVKSIDETYFYGVPFIVEKYDIIEESNVVVNTTMNIRDFCKEFNSLIKYEYEADVSVAIMAFNHLIEDEPISVYISVKIGDDTTSYDIKEIQVADWRNITDKEEKSILKEVKKLAKAFNEKYSLYEFNVKVYDNFICTP